MWKINEETSIFPRIFHEFHEYSYQTLGLSAPFSSPKSTFKRAKRSLGMGVGILHSIGSINRGPYLMIDRTLEGKDYWLFSRTDQYSWSLSLIFAGLRIVKILINSVLMFVSGSDSSRVRISSKYIG